MLTKLALSIIVLASFAGAVQALDLPKAEISLERYYQYPILNGRSPSAPEMSPDGSKIVFGWNQTGARRLDVWIMDYPSGEKRQIVSATQIERLPRQDDDRTEQQKKEEELYDGGIAGFDWAPNGQEFLFNYRGRVWRCKPDGSGLTAVFDTTDYIGQASYSPDGRYISFLRDANLYRVDLTTGSVKQLTFISKSQTSIDGYTWAPDGKNIAVSWSDDSKMGRHVMMDFSKDRATVVNIQRMWLGDQSVDTQVGIISAEGGLVKFVEGLPRYNWRVALDWSPDGSMLAVGWFSDDFKKYSISVVPVGTMKKFDAYTEIAPMNYLPDFRKVVWTRDSKSILFTTDVLDKKFSFRSLLSVNPDGSGLKRVYAEDHDIAGVMRPKHSDRIILVTMKRSSLQSEITVVEPDGERTTHVPIDPGMATPKNFDDAGLPLVSEDGTKMATVANSRTLNSELYAVEPMAKRLTESQLPEFQKIKWAEMKEVTFKAPDGEVIHGLLIQKPGLDKKKRRPAFISSMYANSAKQAWAGYLENYAAMELDMVVLQVDFRGSWGQGGEFNSGYYKKMGIIDADEAVAAKNYLVSLGYVEPKRVGVWGWSYGGFLTCMIQTTKGEAFHTGVAVASVTDWSSYNEWYTRRRLGMPKDNPEVYKLTSPIYHTSGLKNDLMLVHGMLDDNVLFQDTARFMQRLIDDGKYFEVMAYPRDDHGIGKDTSRPHVFATVMRHLYEKLSEPVRK